MKCSAPSTATTVPAGVEEVDAVRGSRAPPEAREIITLKSGVDGTEVYDAVDGFDDRRIGGALGDALGRMSLLTEPIEA